MTVKVTFYRNGKPMGDQPIAFNLNKATCIKTLHDAFGDSDITFEIQEVA